jgi:hypothetical protein
MNVTNIRLIFTPPSIKTWAGFSLMYTLTLNSSFYNPLIML